MKTHAKTRTVRSTICKSLLLSATLLAAGAHAEGLYIGGSAGGSHDKSVDLTGLSTDHSDSGLKLYGGYTLNPYVSLEGGYVDLGKFNAQSGGSVKASGYFLDAVGTLPLGNNFSALGRVGAFNGKLDASSTGLYGSDRGTSLKLGAGLEYAIDKNLAVRGEWERYRFDALGSRPDVDLYSVGVRYRF